MRAASTDSKFDPTVLARHANGGGCAPIQGLRVLRGGSILPSGGSIRNAGSGKMSTMTLDPTCVAVRCVTQYINRSHSAIAVTGLSRTGMRIPEEKITAQCKTVCSSYFLI